MPGTSSHFTWITLFNLHTSMEVDAMRIPISWIRKIQTKLN